ncbi:2-amino-4-hydroxy-6-hydroxymethyldihydropteridine diphosphokinase [Frigoribacterium sp. 2-23]|uniref:2-amino-4-hydroxy-6- hydroxymethyldihydropteridine diphosphokinase n=1 Tax=Frigoribacterium sp. 2-23 TaxID=3415006 RepID=UPI003C6FD8E6
MTAAPAGAPRDEAPRDEAPRDGAPRDAAGPVVHRAVIALGANLGDREATLRAAAASIADTDGITVIAASSPVSSIALTLTGLDDSKPDYLNAVMIVDTVLEARALLAVLNGLEDAHGRTRDTRWGDRTLDLDIVQFGDVVSDDRGLTLPHPRAAERGFVLEPWSQIDPEARLLNAGRVADLLGRIPEAERTRVLPGAAPLWRPVAVAHPERTS